MKPHSQDKPDANALLLSALQSLPQKPSDTVPQSTKKRYSELASQHIAYAIAEELRRRGLSGARPGMPGDIGLSGAERRMAGGIGAKKVDVTWATEESGLLLAVSIKTINFKDSKTQNLKKNVPNRRADMLFEAVTLHRRFPYAVLAGMLFFDRAAGNDAKSRSPSTLDHAHRLFKLFHGRYDPAGRDEQYEMLCIGLMEADPTNPWYELHVAGDNKPRPLPQVLDALIELVAERNPDFYECVNGTLKPVRSKGST